MKSENDNNIGKKKSWIGSTILALVAVVAPIIVPFLVTGYQIRLEENQAQKAEGERYISVLNELVEVVEEHVTNKTRLDVLSLFRLADFKAREKKLRSTPTILEIVEKAEYNMVYTQDIEFEEKQQRKEIFNGIYREIYAPESFPNSEIYDNAVNDEPGNRGLLSSSSEINDEDAVYNVRAWMAGGADKDAVYAMLAWMARGEDRDAVYDMWALMAGGDDKDAFPERYVPRNFSHSGISDNAVNDIWASINKGNDKDAFAKVIGLTVGLSSKIEELEAKEKRREKTSFTDLVRGIIDKPEGWIMAAIMYVAALFYFMYLRRRLRMAK